MRRKIALVLVCFVLLVGAVANLMILANPPTKLTTYFRTHQYRRDDGSLFIPPDYEVDVPATATRLVGANLTVAFLAAAICIVGGLVPRRNRTLESIAAMFFLRATADSIITAIRAGRQKAANETLDLLDMTGLTAKIEKAAALAVKEKNQTGEQLETFCLSLRDVVRQWADSQNATRDSLIKAITEKMGLTPEQAKAAGDAIASRFQERLEAAKKAEVIELLQRSGQDRLEKKAAAIAHSIFLAIYLGTSDSEAVWTNISTKAVSKAV